MNVLVTGSNGFIARNLILRIKEISSLKVLIFNKKTNLKKLEILIEKADIIFHLAGENRTNNKKKFIKNNVILTRNICNILIKKNLKKKLIFTSSIQVKNNSNYGKSKKQAEDIINSTSKKNISKFIIVRLPNIFGKWCKPNYNSVIATFCDNIIKKKKNLLIKKNKIISFIYIDDLIEHFLKLIKKEKKFYTKNLSNLKLSKIYKISVKNLDNILQIMNSKRDYLSINGFNRDFLTKLYSTFITYLPYDKFSYDINNYSDERGVFCEFIKIKKFGQFSYFTINKKKIRGNHYHNSKVEKFIILKGKVRFIFQNLKTKKKINFMISENSKKVVESIPGWAHSIENVGNEIAMGLIWANEVFDSNKPDTYMYNIK